MRCLMFAGLALLAVVEGTVTPGLGYHAEVGIPEAARIKAEEDLILSKVKVDENAEERGSKIVGGALSPVNAYPYLVGLLISFSNVGYQSACGGSLLSSNRAVTAGHCWFDGVNQAYEFEVVLGSQYLYYYGTRVTTRQVYIHPQYNPSLIQNDVAVIYLPYSIGLSAAIQPVSLPSPNQLYDTFEGQWATAIGYGKTTDLEAGVSSNTMQRHVSLRVISNNECYQSFGYFIVSSTLCTSGWGGSGNVGICGGDSGGPLTVRQGNQDVLIGISSFVASNACHMGYPSAFARVTSFYSFIAQHL